MKHSKVITGILVAGALAGCAQKQLVEPASAATFRVAEVSVSLEDGPQRSADFYDLTEADVAAALKVGLDPAFGAANPAGTRVVVAEVLVTRMIIANPGVGLLVGQKTSGVQADIEIKDLATGQTLALAEKVTGTTKPRPTLAGSAFIRDPQGELALVSEEFARRAVIAVFGDTPEAGAQR